MPSVCQLVPNLGWHDAIANEAFLLKKTIAASGRKTELFYERCHPQAAADARPVADFHPEEWDITIFHYSTGTGLVERVARAETRYVLLYHNITPAEYFYGINPDLVAANLRGRAALASLLPYCTDVWADSAYNLAELHRLGLAGGRVFPYSQEITAHFYDAEREPLVLAVGRLASNKGYEFMVEAFAKLSRRLPKYRLTIIGHDRGTAVYRQRLERRIAELGLDRRVHLAGEVSQEELWEWYGRARALAVTSRHEGFCVPLLEAMAMRVPVVALQQPAVEETLGHSGCLVTAPDPSLFAAALEAVLTDEALRGRIIAAQLERRQDFAEDTLRLRLEKYLREVMAPAWEAPGITAAARVHPSLADHATARLPRVRGSRARRRLEPLLRQQRPLASAAAGGAAMSILMVNLGHFGDVILTTPLLRAIKNTRGVARLGLLSAFSEAELGELVPWADHFHTLHLAPFHAGALRYPAGLKPLRELQYGFALSARPDYAHHLAAYLSGAGFVVGETGGPYDDVLTDGMALPPLNLPVYEGERIARLAQPLCVAVTDFNPVIAVPRAAPDRIARCGLVPGTYAVCHPGGGVPANWWPEEAWRELLRRWTAQGEVVAVIGGPAEQARAGRIVGGLPGVTDLTGTLTWGETASILSGCRAFAGSDSGPLHLAAALRKPSVALFGPDDPVRFAPRTAGSGYLYRQLPCSPCPQVTGGASVHCQANSCLTAITPDDVWAEMKKLGLVKNEK